MKHKQVECYPVYPILCGIAVVGESLRGLFRQQLAMEVHHPLRNPFLKGMSIRQRLAEGFIKDRSNPFGLPALYLRYVAMVNLREYELPAEVERYAFSSDWYTRSVEVIEREASR